MLWLPIEACGFKPPISSCDLLLFCGGKERSLCQLATGDYAMDVDSSC
jgi:hypothetical protein